MLAVNSLLHTHHGRVPILMEDSLQYVQRLELKIRNGRDQHVEYGVFITAPHVVRFKIYKTKMAKQNTIISILGHIIIHKATKVSQKLTNKV